MFKTYLTNLIANKQKRAKELREKIMGAETADEVRSLGNELTSLDEEIRDAQAQLKAVEDEERKAQTKEERGTNFDPSQTLASVQMTQGSQQRENENPLATMEYREAFMHYVQRGEMSDVLRAQMEQRNPSQQTSSDLGVLLPMTVMQEIMTGVEKVYGQLYSRVRKTNIRGGVKYPIGSFSATFKRITETTVSERQRAGSTPSYVEFSYNIGEIRIAQTLLASILSVPVFEKELAKVIIEAYVKAMDKEIMVGGNSTLFPTEYANQCTGILTEAANIAQTTSRFYGLSDHIIEFTAEEMADWKSFQTKLFAKIPLSMRALKPQFVMTANTYEANIKTLKDDNNRPLYTETFNPIDGSEISKFKGKDVVFVEDDILKDFDAAQNGEYFGMYWVPEQAYAINTNLEFYVKRYFDEETNQYVDKALVINDGKVLDANYIYLFKKKIVA